MSHLENPKKYASKNFLKLALWVTQLPFGEISIALIFVVDRYEIKK